MPGQIGLAFHLLLPCGVVVRAFFLQTTRNVEEVHDWPLVHAPFNPVPAFSLCFTAPGDSLTFFFTQLACRRGSNWPT